MAATKHTAPHLYIAHTNHLCFNCQSRPGHKVHDPQAVADEQGRQATATALTERRPATLRWEGMRAFSEEEGSARIYWERLPALPAAPAPAQRHPFQPWSGSPTCRACAQPAAHPIHDWLHVEPGTQPTIEQRLAAAEDAGIDDPHGVLQDACIGQTEWCRENGEREALIQTEAAWRVASDLLLSLPIARRMALMEVAVAVVRAEEDEADAETA